MAAYNAAPYIGEALVSLIDQTMPDLEILVVDDGSTDETAHQVELLARRDPRIRLLQLKRNGGQSAALNAGVAQARGRYLSFLDADDEAMPSRLAEQVAAFERDPELVLVGGSVVTRCDHAPAQSETWRYACGDAQIRARSLFKCELISGAMTLDHEQVERHHLRFDERLRLGPDWALSFNAMRIGAVANVPSVVMRYRMHAGQATSGMLLMDDVGSDAARLRAELLAWAGVPPTQDELRTHLAVSPCNYWAVGAHPYFQMHRGSLRDDCRRWFERLRLGSARVGRIPAAALEAYLDEIMASVNACLERPVEASPPVEQQAT